MRLRVENDDKLELLLGVVDAEEILRNLICNLMSTEEAGFYLDDLVDEYRDAFDFDEN